MLLAESSTLAYFYYLVLVECMLCVAGFNSSVSSCSLADAVESFCVFSSDRSASGMSGGCSFNVLLVAMAACILADRVCCDFLTSSCPA